MTTRSTPSQDRRRDRQRRAFGLGTRNEWKLIAIGVAIGILVLAGWGAFVALTGEATPKPISTLDAPDFHSLLVAPNDPDRVLFGSHAGIMESDDGGRSWTAGTLRDQDAMQLTSSPGSPETIYATGHDVFVVSHDGGASWTSPEHNLPGTDIHGFAQLQGDHERLFAFVVGQGVHMSTDGGTTWSKIRTQPPGSGASAILSASDTTLYAATDAGIAWSVDSGATWERFATQPEWMVISLAVIPGETDVVVAGTLNGVTRTADTGASWQALGPDDVTVLALAITPEQPDRILLVSDSGAVYRTDDGGASWGG